MKDRTNKKKIIFTEKDKENIISKYKSGISGQKIADEYGCSEITIRRYLRNNGITAKDNPHNLSINDLPKEDKEFIIHNYLNGISAVELGKKYNCGEFCISKFLKDNDINYKDAKHYHYKDFTDTQTNEIINKYKAGIRIIDLSREYECNFQTIKKLIPEDVLQKYKVVESNYNKFRNYSDITLKEKELIVNKYLSGIFKKQLGIEYDLSIDTINKILNEYNISGKDNPNWDKQIKNFNKETKIKVVDMYKTSNYIQEELATIFNCSRDYIKEILYEYNCSYRDNKNYSYNVCENITEEIITNIIKLYNNGVSISKLSQQYNIGNIVIRNILINNNISIKHSDEYYNYTEEELLGFLKEIYEEYGYVNTVLLNILDGYPISNTYTNRFGTFQVAMERAGLPYDSSIIMLDDEICKSGFEYRLSLVLRKYNIKYDRDYLYKYIIPNHTKNHSIDYKINYNNKIIYLEIFGMCGSTIGNGRYDKTKEFKINLCKDNNIPLITLYPDDFKLVNEKFEKHILNVLFN